MTALHTLPIDTVIRARDGRIWQKWGQDTWQPTGLDNPVREHEGVIKMPVTVLHHPDQPRVTVDFATSGAAYTREDGSLDHMSAAGTLMQAADRIAAGSTDGTLWDRNGNTVGAYRVWSAEQ